MRIGGHARDGGDGAVTVAFWAIVLGMLPGVLDQTILSTALPTIASDLGRLADVSWVVTAYVVAAAAFAPLWGKLGDRHGRKVVLEASLDGHRFQWPADSPVLLADTDYQLIVLFRTAAYAPVTLTFTTSATSEMPAHR